ncbi:MAG TPA: hypothetical protein VLC79_14500 [Cellvibrio sp.]|nr:hypothetical protein [Cellvibrio sp.]
MNKVLLIAGIVLSQSLWAGELFSFDKTAVIFSALQQIKLRYSDLAKLELSPHRHINVNEQDGKLFATVFFSYKGDSPLGVLYTCVKINENGELLKIQRDIKPKKGLFDHPMPDWATCS